MMRWLRQRARDERGAVMVIAITAMVAMVGMAAFAIDVGSWYQVSRQVQSAADNAALAGVQDLPANATTAKADANAYVTKALITGATAVVTTPYGGSASEIQVTVTKVAPSIFGKLIGTSSATVTESAVAKAVQSTNCGTPGDACYAVFTSDTSCTTGGITMGGGTTIVGGVHSNGLLNVGGGGSSYGPTTYGNGSGCTVSPAGYQSQTNSFSSGPTAEAPIVTWPIDYSTDFPACTSTCTGPGGTPSFCTQASTAASWTIVSYYPGTLTSDNIYCGVGTGTASTPSTWNGALTVDQSGTPAIVATYVAGTLSFGGGSSLTACGYSSTGYSAANCGSVPAPATGNYPVGYAIGGGTSAIEEPGGGGTLTGDLFAPNGTITIGGGTATTFLEGKDVSASGGGVTGDGPSDSGSGTSPSGSSLVQ